MLRDVTVVADQYYSVFLNPGATATIESGTYSCTNNSVALFAYYKDNPTKGFVINGGTFLTNGKPFSLHTTDANYIQPTVRGGVFDIDITQNTNNGKVVLEEGYVINQRSDGMWEVTHN